MRHHFWFAIAITATGCLDPAVDRRAWVIDQLADDNRAFAQREPALVAGKLLKLQRRAYDWLRGTAALYWRDLTQPGAWSWPTAFGDAASSRVLVLGDPHVENLGTFRTPDGTMLIEWNDFDGAGYGPYWGDVRRLATSWIIAGGDRLAEPADAALVAVAVAHGYGDEIEALAGGAQALAVEAGANAIFDDLLDGALEDGDEREKLEEYTDVDGLGQRIMFFGDIEAQLDGVYSDTLVPVGREGDVVPSLIARWRVTLDIDAPDAAFAIKGVARRLGAGVASYANLRFYVLLEGPTADLADDWLVELKETGDGLRIPGLADYGPGFLSAGERVVWAQRVAAADPVTDDLLGWADHAPLSFRVRHRIGYQKGLAVDDVIGMLRDGAGGVNDLATIGELSGRMLARAHARAPGADQAPGLAAIAPRLAGNVDAFAAETAQFATAYAAQIHDDWLSIQDIDLFAEVFP